MSLSAAIRQAVPLRNEAVGIAPWLFPKDRLCVKGECFVASHLIWGDYLDSGADCILDSKILSWLLCVAAYPHTRSLTLGIRSNGLLALNVNGYYIAHLYFHSELSMSSVSISERYTRSALRGSLPWFRVVTEMAVDHFFANELSLPSGHIYNFCDGPEFWRRTLDV